MMATNNTTLRSWSNDAVTLIHSVASTTDADKTVDGRFSSLALAPVSEESGFGSDALVPAYTVPKSLA